MDWIKKRTHIIDHEKFLAAGAIGRDLYDWGLLWSGEHETDGAIPMIAVLSSAWGAGGKANIKVATHLVTVELWARTDTGFLSLQWAEQGNETKQSLAAKREAAKARKSRGGSRELFANGERTGVKGSNSLSVSPSGYGSVSQIALSTDDAMPEWFEGACDAAAATAVGDVPSADRPALWVQYLARSQRKGWAMNHGDAVGWITSVVRSERERASSRPSSARLVQGVRPGGRLWKIGEET